VAWLLGLVAGAGLAWAQGTAFSYQGQLTDGAAAANGTYDLRFTLWNAATAGAPQGATLTQAGVGVTNGLFTATLDFGAQFSGPNRWLEIAVRTNGAADFTTLAERQPVLPTPYAIHAATAGSATTATTATTVTGPVPAAQLTGSLTAAQIPNLDAGKITSGTFTGNGLGLTNVPLSALVPNKYAVLGWGANDAGQTAVPAGSVEPVAIAAGENHSLLLLADGTVTAWGGNTNGQLDVPPGLADVVAISTSWRHSLALKLDGTVVAWGDNSFGQATVPPGLNGVRAIAAGFTHNLALKFDGTVVAWGLNWVGATEVPAGLQDVVGVTIAEYTSIALKSDGTVVSWGSPTFAPPPGLAGVVAISGCGPTAIALKADGTVTSWGAAGEAPEGLHGVVAVAAGPYHGLALKADATVAAWGANENGQASVPPGLDRVVSIAGGWAHSLVTRAEPGSAWPPLRFARLDQANVFQGTVAALGFSGNGSRLTSLNASELTAGVAPVARIPDLDAAKIVTGTLAAARIPSLDASKVTVGTFATAQIPNLDAAKITTGTLAAARIPNLDASKVTTGVFTAEQIPDLDAGKITSGVLSPDRIPTLDANKISGGTFSGNGAGLTEIPLHALVQDDYAVAAWGSNSDGRASVPAGLRETVTVAAGAKHNLALKADGTVVAWGYNTDGQTTVPAGLSGVVAIAAGGRHSLALKTDGTVVAWGRGFEDQTNVPAGLGGVLAIAAGYDHSLALKADGTVVVWGRNDEGQATVSPALVGKRAVAIAAGEAHSMALTSLGDVIAWGRNTAGQANPPDSIMSDAVAIAAGRNHSLAIRQDGTVVAWGRSIEGQTNVPGGLSGVTAISAGAAHSLALKSDGTVVAWGFDYEGESTVPAGLNGVVGISAGWHHNVALRSSGARSVTVARLDRGNVFRGTVSAVGFSGDGSGLTSLDASALTSGTLNDARLSANVALFNGNPKFTSKVSIGGGTADSPLTVAAAGAGLSPEIVTRFRNTTAGQHTGVAVDALGGQDAVLYLGNNGVREWDFRYDDSSGELQFRTQPDNVSRMVLTRTGNLAVTGALSQASDRNVKAGFAPVDVDAVLAKVASLPLTTWHYTNDAAATPHLGPMAQDFHAAFSLGGDDKSIATVDADGVALAAIQGLHRTTEVLAAENAELRGELTELRTLVLQLQQQLNANRP
jgi:alpha-tubulin suppressor-like RCC1 family protein